MRTRSALARGLFAALACGSVVAVSSCREEALPAATATLSPATRTLAIAALPREGAPAPAGRGARLHALQAAAPIEYAFHAAAGDALADNPAQHLRAHIAAEGVRVVASESGPALALHVAGIGRGDHLAALRSSRAVAMEGNALTLDRGGVREWYLNGPLGLEQGFTLDEPPAAGDAELTVAIDVDAPFQPSADGDSVRLTEAGSGRLLHYGALTAYDAAQRELPSHLEVTGQRIVLHVDDRGATYPVVIDPLVSVEEFATGAGENVAVAFDTVVSGDSNNNKAYVYARSGSSWAFSQQLAGGATYYGSSVAIDGDLMAVGARWDSAKGAGVGSVFLYGRAGATWTPTTKLYPNMPQLASYFGSSVAMRGDRVIVGASAQGTVSMFARAGGIWSFQNQFAGGQVGYGGALAIDGQSGVAVVGAFNQAYVYAESAGAWAAQDTFNAPVAGKGFGSTVGVSGGAIVVGAGGDDGAVATSGAAYVYRRTGSVWTQTQKLVASDGAAGDHFGEAVGMANGLLVVGAPDTDVNGTDTGAVYVFEDQGGTYVETLKVIQDGNAPPPYFGQALSFDGSRMAVLNSKLYVFALLTPGGPCAQSSDCGGGFCVDGVCCASDCGGGKTDDCVACSVAAGAAQDGICGPVTDSTGCDDQDLCSASSTCQAGVCVGQNLTVCPSPGNCQVGACAPATGLCGGKPAPQGTDCDDGDACTTFDICGAFSKCIGLSPVVCAGDACNNSACDPTSGGCVKTPKADGATCDDGNACTQMETCTAGACAGAPVVCTAPDECHDAGVCGAGGCNPPPKPDGTMCSVGTCVIGVCTPPGSSATSSGSATSTSAAASSTTGVGGSPSATSAGAGGSSAGGSDGGTATASGCGCAVVGTAPGSWASAMCLLGLASALARRRRGAARSGG